MSTVQDLAHHQSAADATPAAMLARCAGWHPIGLVGIAAAVAGALMAAAWAMGPDHARLDPNSRASAWSANSQLEARRAALADHLSRFPAADERAAQVAAIVSLAEAHGLETDSGEYHSAASSMPGELMVLELRLPLHGAPDGVRGFLAGLQREMPWLAIDHLRFERDEKDWRGELRGRLFLREGT